MDKVILNQNGLKKTSAETKNSPLVFGYGEKVIQDNVYYSLKAKVLAVGIFLFFFFENGALGLIPEQYYMIYRSIRISDLILYALVIYSVFRYKEYKELIKSRSLIIIKIYLSYLVFEFVLSALTYKFNVIEYFFRLKLVWTSFLVFPYLLLLKRDGLGFLIKLFFPAAVIANILYILSAITGTAFLPDVRIITQSLPGNLEVYRVYGGTFLGEFFFLGFIYYWMTRKFKLYQLFFVILFIIPHILAFGRSAWALFVFTILIMVLLITWKKKKIKVLFKQVAIFILLTSTLVFCFLKFIPNADYYVEALGARLQQGTNDVKYEEGSFGERTVFDNEILLNVWQKNNWLVGIGMHPLWVYKQESRDERLIYIALTDVTWPGVLAVYGAIGFALALFFQIYYIKLTFKLIKKSKHEGVLVYILITMMSKMIFAALVTYSYILFSIGILGIGSVMSFMVAVAVYCYEQQKNEKEEKTVTVKPVRQYYLYGKYSYSYSKTYRQREL